MLESAFEKDDVRELIEELKKNILKNFSCLFNNTNNDDNFLNNKTKLELYYLYLITKKAMFEKVLKKEGIILLRD